MLSNIVPEYDAIYEKGNAIIMGDLYPGARSVPYTKVTSGPIYQGNISALPDTI